MSYATRTITPFIVSIDKSRLAYVPRWMRAGFPGNKRVVRNTDTLGTAICEAADDTGVASHLLIATPGRSYTRIDRK